MGWCGDLRNAVSKRFSGVPVTEWEIGPWINGQTRSRGMPRYMAKMPDGTHSFLFPASDGVHYVYRSTGPLRVGGSIRIMAEITGNGEFVPSAASDVPPCDFQLYVERSDNGWEARDPFERMFSAVSSTLKFGTRELEVPLMWEHWEGILNHVKDASKFADCLARAKSVGMGFSGANFAGHGCWVRGGSATFTLRSFAVT